MMLDILLQDHRRYHSDWQCDYAITVRAGGTLYGCYKQAVRELHKRWRGLREIYSQEAGEDAAELMELRGITRDTEREFLRFYGQAVALRRALGLADGEPMPDDLRERLDVEMWEHRIRAMAAIDFMTSGALTRGTVELLQACPPAMRQTIAADILNQSRHSELIQWFLNHDPQIPAPLAIPQEEAVALLTEFRSKRGLPSSTNSMPVVRSSIPLRLPSDCDTASHAGDAMGYAV